MVRWSDGLRGLSQLTATQVSSDWLAGWASGDDASHTRRSAHIAFLPACPSTSSFFFLFCAVSRTSAGLFCLVRLTVGAASPQLRGWLRTVHYLGLCNCCQLRCAVGCPLILAIVTVVELLRQQRQKGDGTGRTERKGTNIMEEDGRSGREGSDGTGGGTNEAMDGGDDG